MTNLELKNSGLVELRQKLLKEMLGAVGENSVIGAGAIVSRDIPANVLAMGVECRVVREITNR